jgi:TonB family protein
MNTAVPKASRAFWIGGFVFLFLLHAFAIFRFGDRTESESPGRQTSSFRLFAVEPKMERQLAMLTGDREPTLFALPHPKSFSGGAWLKFQPEAPKLSNWTSPPEWLALPADQLGISLDDYLATNRPSEEPLLAALRVTKALTVRIPNEPVITNTMVRVEGPLASRSLVRMPPLPSAVHTDALRNPTMVSVSVNAEGVVETASLASGSGLKAADDRAVELARQFEFQPAAIRNIRDRERAAPTIGRLIFTWHVVTEAAPVAAGAR